MPVFGPLWNGKGKPTGLLMISCVSGARAAASICRHSSAWALQAGAAAASWRCQLGWAPLGCSPVVGQRNSGDGGAGFVLLSCFSLHWEEQWGAQGAAQCAEASQGKLWLCPVTRSHVFLQPCWGEPSLGLDSISEKPKRRMALPAITLILVSAPAFPEMGVCKKPRVTMV